MIVETRSTPKMPVAVFTRVSFLARIWWDWHAIAARLFTNVRNIL
jgi:hypothetical protein